MPLQNRVQPDGTLIAGSARGLFTGNRGVIHDPDAKTLTGRRWSTAAWICCSLTWKGRQRDVWGRNYIRRDGTRGAGWSELFFLDEVTALAAGHRPCHTCRSQDAKAFHAAFCAANGEMDASGKNDLLHRERWHSSRNQPQTLKHTEIAALPDGAIIMNGEAFFAIKDDALLPWALEGYGALLTTDMLTGSVLLVTPPSIIGALREGYQPRWHDSAEPDANRPS